MDPNSPNNPNQNSPNGTPFDALMQFILQGTPLPNQMNVNNPPNLQGFLNQNMQNAFQHNPYHVQNQFNQQPLFANMSNIPFPQIPQMQQHLPQTPQSSQPQQQIPQTPQPSPPLNLVDEDEIVQETQPENLRKGARKHKKKDASESAPQPPKRLKWTDDEEAALAAAFIAISTDPIVGNNQGTTAFWEKILEHFHGTMGRGEYRSADGLSGKWRDLRADCTRFNGIYTNSLTEQRSGTNPFDVLDASASKFKAKYNNRTFTHMKAWKVLHNNPKWKWQQDSASLTQSSGSKRSRMSEPEVGSVDLNVPIDVEENASATNIDPDEPLQRPIGRNKAKRLQKQQQTASSSTSTKHVAEIVADQLSGKLDQHLEFLKLQFEKREERQERFNREQQLQQQRFNQEQQMQRDMEMLGYIPNPELPVKDLQAIEKLKDKIRAKWNLNDD